MIHDAARPFPGAELIERTVFALGSHKAAIAAVEKAGGIVTLPQPKPETLGKGKAHERKAKKDREVSAAKPEFGAEGDTKGSNGLSGGTGKQISEGANKLQKESDEAEAD